MLIARVQKLTQEAAVKLTFCVFLLFLHAKEETDRKHELRAGSAGNLRNDPAPLSTQTTGSQSAVRRTL